jgi:DNA-binding MarR family transcriptional regulator
MGAAAEGHVVGAGTYRSPAPGAGCAGGRFVERRRQCSGVDDRGLYTEIVVSPSPRSPASAPGVLAERRDSPGLLLALLGQTAMRRLREAHTANDLSPRQFRLLALLHDRGPLGQGELGQTLETDPSVLVTQLNPLEQSGLISRRRDPDDRRRHLVTLTAAGERRLERAARAQREVEDELFEALDDEDREHLRKTLIAVRESGPSERLDCGSTDSAAADGGCSR